MVDRPKLPEFSAEAAHLLNALRQQGWTVAVHNDYMLDGEPHTFWLFTKNGLCIKGEGKSDAQAIASAHDDRKRLLRAPCFDCACEAPAYMVKDEVWRQAFPSYAEVKRTLLKQHKGTPTAWQAHVYLCFDCLAKRLGRPLTPDDFRLELPINSGISMGLRLGSHES